LVNKKDARPVRVLSMSHVAEARTIEVKDRAIHVGAAVTLDELANVCETNLPEMHGYLEWFASPLIRNHATLAGNVATGSPIGDMMPPLFALDATIELRSVHGTRLIRINDFYTGYRTSVMRPGELISRVIIPLPGEGDLVRFAKVSRRKDMDISAVSVSVWIKQTGDLATGGVIANVRIAAGGVAATTVRLSAAEAALTGQPFERSTFDRASEAATREITPISDHRGSSDYRRLLVGNLIRRFFHEQTRVS